MLLGKKLVIISRKLSNKIKELIWKILVYDLNMLSESLQRLFQISLNKIKIRQDINIINFFVYMANYSYISCLGE